MKYKLIGAVICWWRAHHIYGHKRKMQGVKRWVYTCSRCGHIKEGALPIKRGKQ